MISNAHYLTYFKGPGDIVFYSCGKGSHPDDESVKAVAVFYPDEKNGKRIQPSSKKRYTRLIINGFPKDKRNIKTIPLKTQKTLLRLFFKDHLTGEPMLRVPIKQVKEIYKPRDSLNKLLKNPPSIPGLDRIIKDIRYSIQYLSRHGITIKNLGFYGSFQGGIYYDDYINNEGDIDLLIYGLRYQKKIVTLIHKHHSRHRYKKMYMRGGLDKKLEKRRRDLSVLSIKDNNRTIDLHLTLVRSRGDKFSFVDPSTIKLQSKTTTIAGKIIDSTEGLTCPSVYKVKTDKGVVTVLSRYYIFTKTAYNGDDVVARGRVSKNNKYLAITDPEKHYIVTTNQL